MSRLRVFEEGSPARPRLDTSEPREIGQQLERSGVRFERWTATAQLVADVDQETVLAAYERDVARLMHDNGYRSVDVVRMRPDSPQRVELRAKFLKEHTHSEDEVRFFVDGKGMFYLRVEGGVHAVLCERGDLLSVPAGMRHWFDMGPQPHFAAIRLFTNPAGWVAEYTGSAIAERFPKLDDADLDAATTPLRGASGMHKG